MPGEYFPFGVFCRSGAVCVTIKSESKQINRNDFVIANNYSVIVDENGQVQRTELGEIWIDQSGKNHSRADKN